MPKTRKFYMRVRESLVLPVEIHVLETQSGQNYWFEEKHLQEAVQIVREAIESRLTQSQTAGKGNQQSSAIITGDSLRLGYIFKARPGSQHCLVPESCLTQQEQQEFEEEDLHSLSVAKEKLIIYACQRQVGSPQAMSQLVRVMGEKTNSTSKGLSISSYFQKVTGGSKSGSSTTSTSPTSTTGAPKTGGKRNILKKIIQKSDSNVSNKRKKASKTTSSKRESTIHQYLSKDKDSDTSGKAVTVSESQGNHLAEDKDTTTSKSLQIMANDLNQTGSENSLEDNGDSNFRTRDSPQNQEAIQMQRAEITHLPIIDITQGTETEQTTVRISQVFNSPVSLSTEGTSSAGSVTLISVDQMHEIQQQKLTANQLPRENHSAIPLGDTVSEKQSHVVSHDKIRNHSGSDLDETVLPSASFVSQSGSGMQSLVVSTEMNNKLKVGLKKVTNLHNTSPKLDSLIDSADSPVFSKKKSEKLIPVNVLGDWEKFQNRGIEGETESNCNMVHSNSQIAKSGKENKLKRKLPNFSDSDVDTGVNEPNQLNSKLSLSGTNKMSQDSTRLKRKLPNFSDSDVDIIGVNEPSQSNKKGNLSQSQKVSQENKRLKRNLPDLSGSDSDDNDLPLISRKPRPPNKKKFVTLDEMNKNVKKFSISKSFFSGKDEKLQPTLSFFMGDKSKKTRSEKPAAIESELNKEELENLDCTLIEELSAAVKVKGETDAEIKREIKDLKEVDELNEEQLNFMVRTSEPYLRDIFEGKKHSSRHMAYKKGGNSKRDLNFRSCLKLYSEEQIDTVMEALMSIFCKRHHKYLDYIMKVLLPEMLIKFHMEIHNLGKEESERKLMA